MFQGPLEDVLVLDVACGTGLVAQEVTGAKLNLGLQEACLGCNPIHTNLGANCIVRLLSRTA